MHAASCNLAFEEKARDVAAVPLSRMELQEKGAGTSAPDLAALVQLAGEFKVSKQAMSRSYADYHEKLAAVIGVKDNRIIWISKNRVRFPFIQPRIGDAVPSAFHALQKVGSLVPRAFVFLAARWTALLIVAPPRRD
jgi:hypothetical protein